MARIWARSRRESDSATSSRECGRAGFGSDGGTGSGYENSWRGLRKRPSMTPVSGFCWSRILRKALTVAPVVDQRHGSETDAVPAASFFDVDGTLVRTNLLHPTVFYLANQNNPLRSLGELARAALGGPRMARGRDARPPAVQRAALRGVRGHLARTACCSSPTRRSTRVIKPAIYPGARDLVDPCRDKGHDVVLVSGALDFLMERLAKHLGATGHYRQPPGDQGRLRDRQAPAPRRRRPREGAPHPRARAAAHGHDLDECFAYSDSYSDVPMLSVVGHPAAVNPDLRLRKLARPTRGRQPSLGAPLSSPQWLERLAMTKHASPRSRRSAPFRRSRRRRRRRPSYAAAAPAATPGRHARQEERPAHALLGRPAGRGRPARRHARHLSAPAARGAEGRRRGDPLRAQPPATTPIRSTPSSARG